MSDLLGAREGRVACNQRYGRHYHYAMDIEKFSAGICPIGRGLARVGDAWSMLILRDAGLGLTRFDQFRASLGIAPNILARRLKALTEAGLLTKNKLQRPPAARRLPANQIRPRLSPRPPRPRRLGPPPPRQRQTEPRRRRRDGRPDRPGGHRPPHRRPARHSAPEAGEAGLGKPRIWRGRRLLSNSAGFVTLN